VHGFRLPHALHIGQQFNEFPDISNTHSNLGFGIHLLLRLILLAFPMLISRVVGLTEKALLVHVILLDLLLFVGLLTNNLLSHNPP
jgi:ABC-type transport system involved in multi-copper enzyme maturation permease subunit